MGRRDGLSAKRRSRLGADLFGLRSASDHHSLGDLLLQGWSAVSAADRNGVSDEALHTVSARAAAAKEIGKADIGALVLWKRVTANARWANQLMLTSDRRFEPRPVLHINGPTTRLSISRNRVRPRERRCGTYRAWGTAALASAVLLALAPYRMAVWDRRVASRSRRWGCTQRRGVGGFYGRYLTTTLELAKAMDEASTEGRCFLPRDVDLALFYIAGDPDMLSEARLTSSM